MQISIPPYIKMKHAIILFFITPLCGLFAALMLALSPPALIANQYQLSLSLDNFFYNTSQWTLSLTNTQDASSLSIPLSLRHGPWLGSTNFGFLSIEAQPSPQGPQQAFQATMSFLGTLSYSATLNAPLGQFPSSIEGSFNIFSHRTEAAVQGSFPLFLSNLSNAQLHFISEKSFLGTPSLTLAAEVENLTYPNPDRPIQIHNLKVDLIPSFGSWRGSLIAAIRADRWIEPAITWVDLESEISILNAKTKRLADCLDLASNSLPISPSSSPIQITQYQGPQSFLDLIDLVDPEWASFTLSSLQDTWFVRVSDGGENVQIDAQGVGKKLHTLWNTFLSRSLLANLSAGQTWNDDSRYILLSSSNFQDVLWRPATAVEIPTP